MEGVEVDSSGFKLNAGTNKVEDAFGTVLAATQFSYSAQQRTLWAHVRPAP